MTVRVVCDDALVALAALAPDSVDAMVTDPPAGIAFMGRSWDTDKGGRDEWIAWLASIMREAYRVLKPGAHGLVWALPRTQHWTATALEDAGFEIRDVVTHLFGSGFPKNMNVAKAIDAHLGVKPTVVGQRTNAIGMNKSRVEAGYRDKVVAMNPDLTVATSPQAKAWDGWGTAIKPSAEAWILVRKPLAERTVAANVLRFGTGALNIDACRIETSDAWSTPASETSGRRGGIMGPPAPRAASQSHPAGRFPGNVVLSHHPLCEVVGQRALPGRAPVVAPGVRQGGFMDVGATSAASAPCGPVYGPETVDEYECIPGCAVAQMEAQEPGSTRFLYCAKPSVSEKQTALTTLSLFDAPGKAFKCKCKGESVSESAGQKAHTPADLATPRAMDTTALGSPLKSEIASCMTSFGNAQTVQFHSASKSTTETATSKITTLQTLSLPIDLPTSASMADAKLETECGGSRAQSAQSSSPSPPNFGISTETDTCATDDAKAAIAKSSASASGFCDKCGGFKAFHVTVKAVALMRWLCRLVTPPGGLVVDPFGGSGTTGVAAIEEGFGAIIIEREPDSAATAIARIERAARERGVK